VRALLVPMSWGRGQGPISEMLALAAAARDAGVDVTFASRPRFCERVTDRGFEVVAELPELPDRPIDQTFFSDFASFQGLDREDFVRTTLDAERRAIELAVPDVVFSYLQPTAAISARLAGVRIGSIARWSEHPRFCADESGFARPSGATRLFNSILTEAGLPPVRDLWDLAYLWSDFKLACSTPELEPGLRTTQHLTYVGHLLAPDPMAGLGELENSWARSDGIRVYVYLSAKDVSVQAIVHALRPACDDGEAAALVVDPDCGQASSDSHIFVVPRTDGLAAARSADVVVTSGTKTTCFEALRAGAGLVFVPSPDDELTFWRSKLTSSGVGVTLPSAEPTAAELMTAIGWASRADVRVRCAEVWSSIDALGGPTAAAKTLASDD
jgi:UDP:flavonoid glycosyltransferase YjiC (YdhE family)